MLKKIILLLLIMVSDTMRLSRCYSISRCNNFNISLRNSNISYIIISNHQV